MKGQQSDLGVSIASDLMNAARLLKHHVQDLKPLFVLPKEPPLAE